jgi:arylsulfatase A-like enzyme
MGFTVNIAGSGNGHPQSYLPEEHFGNLPKRGTYASVQNMSQYYGSGIHLTEALTLEALKTLEDPIRRKQPFYLYFAHYSNHTPIQRDERFIRKYLDAGMDEQQARYASMVEGMDKSLGDVLDYLEAKGIADDTIILFMSDNGGHCLGQDKGGEPHTQNLPLREGKASVYEGGIRVPLIFRWPGKAAEGTRLNTPVINEDIFPTILEMAGVKHYETVQECDGLSLVKLITAGSKMVAKAQKRGEIATRKEVNAFVVPASVSGIDPERELIFHYPHQYRVEDQDDIDFMSAVRKGDWKLVYRMHTGELELYNLRDDIGERNDLAASHPERVAELAKALGDRLRAWKAPMPTVRTTGKPVPMPDEL